MSARIGIVGLMLLAALPGLVEAQASVYGVLGIGFPGRTISVRTRALGGSMAAVDAASATNPAVIALNQRLTVSGLSQTTSRNYEAGDTSVTGLSDTRFPFAMVAGPVQRSPIAFGVSYALYSERSYDIVTTDTVTVRGEEVGVADRLKSDGGIADVRAAVAWRVSRRVLFGAGFHLLSGSTREELEREFENPIYAPVSQRGDVDYSGWGISAGVVVTPASRLRFGVSARRDSKLNIEDQLLPTIEVQLPWTFAASVTVAPFQVMRWSVGGEFRNWSIASDDVPETTQLSVFDTWEVSSGIEIGGPDAGSSKFPFRLGFRYATLPFSPVDEQPTEIDLSAGSGILFAGNRALFEFSVERVLRDGGGASERAWQIAIGLTLRP
jgi:hypothetical protein